MYVFYKFLLSSMFHVFMSKGMTVQHMICANKHTNQYFGLLVWIHRFPRNKQVNGEVFNPYDYIIYSMG